jgi:hypothetical protein
MPAILFPTGYFPSPTQSQAIGLGFVYIGEPDTDPTVLGNRISVTVIQEDGTPVTIAPASQPFTLNAGGQFAYGGNVVQLRVDQDYSMTVQTSDAVTLYYFPSVVGGDSTVTSQVVLPALGSHPTPVSNSGILYSLVVAGVAELFYMDENGNYVQFTSNGGFNVQLTNATVEALRLIATEEVEGLQFRGAPIELVIDGDDNVEVDCSIGMNFYLLLDQNVDNIYLTNIPESSVPNLILDIENAGSFTVTTFTPFDGLYEVWIPASVGALQPVDNTITSYGIAIMPNKRVNIYPVEMQQIV